MRFMARVKIPARVRDRPPRCRHGIHSLRGKLTLANVGLLALGIIVATAVSLMGMRHYLLDQVDTELAKTRDSLTGSRLTLHQIDSLTALAFVRDRMAPGTDQSSKPDSIFAVLDNHGAPSTSAVSSPPTPSAHWSPRWTIRTLSPTTPHCTTPPCTAPPTG